MSILTVLILVLGLVLMVVPLFERIGLTQPSGVIAIGIVLGSCGLFAMVDPLAWPTYMANNTPYLESTQLFSGVLLLAGMLLCFRMGLALHPFSLWQKQSSWLTRPLLQWLLLTLSLIVPLAWYTQWSWLSVLCLASVFALGSHLRHYSNDPLGKENSSIQQQYRQRYWLQPLSQTHTLLFLFLFFVLPILATPTQPIQYLAHLMAILMLLSGGLLAVRYALNPLCAHYLKGQQPHFIALVLITFILLFIYCAQFVGLHALVAALLCGMTLTESRYWQVLQQKLSDWHLPILVGLLLPLCLSVDWARWSDIGLWAIGLSVLLCSMKWLVSLLFGRWQSGQWQEATTRAFSTLQLSELAALLLLFAVPNVLATPIQLSATGALITLQQIVLMVILLSFILDALLFLLHRHLVDPLFQYSKFGRNRTTNEPLATDSPAADVMIIGFGRVGQIIARVLHVHAQAFYVVDNRELALDALNIKGIQFIQGDATQQEVLEALPLQPQTRVILCIDDIEDSLTVARYLRLHYPELKLFARARDRAHAHILKSMGIEHVWRETYATALDMADQVLDALGLASDAIVNDRQTFVAHDEHLFYMQQLSGVSMSYTSPHTSTQYNAPLAELKWLFEADAERLQVKSAAPDEAVSSAHPPT